MSWKSVKNILILLLVAVNILLAVFAYNYYTGSRFTDGDTAEKAVTVLEKSGINVSSELLSVKNDTAQALYTSYDRENYVCLVANVLFGKEADGIYMLPDGVRAQTLEGETAYIGYDMSLEFYAAGEKDKVAAALSNAKAVSGDSSKNARTFLENTLSLESGSIKESSCKASGDFVFITMDQTQRGLSLYGMECVFGVRGEKIVCAIGKYFFGAPTGEKIAQLLNRVNILFSEKERGMTGTLCDIELCYTLYEDEESELMLFIPSYALTYADGTVRAVNGVSKKLY